jgi:hypothetical protein
MSWLIYTLLGVLIIVLLVYSIRSLLYKPAQIKEGMIDYFTIEQYLQTIPTTQGHYVRIRPGGFGDGGLTISQIEVLDMNGNNIALKMAVYGSSNASGSGDISLTVDGTSSVRFGGGNVWTTTQSGAYWMVDLGEMQQISQVKFFGQAENNTVNSRNESVTPASKLRTRGMICDILDSTGVNVTATETFTEENIMQTVTFSNSINLSPSSTENKRGLLNPAMIPLNSAQPEVYLVTGSYTQQQAEVTCGLLGAVIATTGQVSTAYLNAANWSNPGWAIVSNQKTREYVLNNPTAAGINTPASTTSTSAAVNCFGIKPARGASSTIAPFNASIWSQFMNNTRPANFGTSTVSVPDVTKLYAFVTKTLMPSTIYSINDSVRRQIPSLSMIWADTDQGRVSGGKVEALLLERYNSISDLDNHMVTVFNPMSCKTMTPPCSVSTPPDSLIARHGSLANQTLYSALEYSPFHLIYDDATATPGQLAGIFSNISIFGTMSAQATADFNASLDLAKKIFLGSDQDVSKYLNISIRDFKPYIRANTGYQNFCSQEVVQRISNGQYVFRVVDANVTKNASVCNVPFTTDMMGLLPSATREYIQIWIYNRIKRLVQYKKSESTLNQADMINLGIPGLTPSADIARIHSSIMKMQPTVGGRPIALDVTNNYILDKIAQAFYEAMGGNYIMDQIYDVSTIGGTIIDVRFDLVKHADISEIQAKIAALRAKYLTIRDSNVSKDILDSAKLDHDSAVADLQEQQSKNILPPVTGVVGRFFYTYSTDTQNFSITGFTLDSRAVTSFIPELNCGVQVDTGGAAGAINYVPTIAYTKNVPEALSCTTPQTLRRIMDDYVDLTMTDLQSVLLGTTTDKGKTYSGIAGVPSMDTTLGTVHVNQIIGAVQISPTQCAVKWTETLWNDASNVPVSAALTNVTRRALFSYAVNTEDWYSNTINIDPSGTAFYPTDSIPGCRIDTVSWQNITAPRLETATPDQIRADFMANGWNNGMGQVCPIDIPNYIFSAQDYCNANANLSGTCYPSGNRELNSAAAKQHYVTTGSLSGLAIRAAQQITPLSPPIVIQKPLPENYTLDSLDGVCPETTCEDLNVLYKIVDEYNKDETKAGSILRVTRAYTANEYQCDVEVDINYDVKVENLDGKKVIKGSFTYDYNSKDLKEIRCKDCPPSDVSRPHSGVTLALSVSRNIEDCSFSLDDSGGRGSGTTIQANTPPLYKPMDYGTFLTDINAPTFNTSFDTINAAITDAALSATSMLTSYRDNTVTATGNIGTLGSGCPTKCTDTAVMNAMIAFYRSQVNRTKQINTVLRMGTLNSTTCDMTFQEDILTPSGSSVRVVSSQTAGMRFTMAPDTAACTFKATAMTPILPESPSSVTLDMKRPPSSAVCNEVYGITANTLTRQTAAEKCIAYNGVLATHKQLADAATTGANWAAKGFVVDVSGVYAPSGSQLSSSFTQTLAGAACYGVKPASGRYPDVLPFAGSQWNQPGACSTTINYVNPSKEAFMNYGTPVQVNESTFPLNKQSFGLDMARNHGGPALDTLYEEPLRAADRPTDAYGPQGIADEALLEPGKAQSYKYIRFNPLKTRDPAHPTVEIGKFRFLIGQSEVDLRFAKVTNPMGTWVGDIQDLVGSGFRRGFSDRHKKTIIFAFPYAMLMDGFTWTTANPDKGVGGDPVQWKLEGSQNGTYWTTLRDQTKHSYPVPAERYQELPVFRF